VSCFIFALFLEEKDSKDNTGKTQLARLKRKKETLF